MRKIYCFSMAALALNCSPLFAADNSVTIYGRIDVGVESFDNGKTTAGRLESYSSRLGFRGKERIGDGLHALFQIEQKIEVDTGESGWRDTFVGLGGDLGELRLGLISTPFKELDAYVCDTWGNGDTCDSILHRGVNSNMNFHTRQQNAMQYTSPTVAGLTAKLMYSPDEERSGELNRSRLSGSLSYAIKGLMAGAAYEVRADDDNKPGDSAKATQILAGYDLGATTVGMGWSSIESEGKDRKRDAWIGTVTQKLGAFKLKASYAQAGESKDGAADGAKMWAVEADYPLSKRSTLYTYFTSLENGDLGQKYEFRGSSGAPAAKGETMKIVALGVRHSF